MNKEEYETFYNALISAERAPLHDCDVSNPKVYEGCMPVEVMAQRGEGTLRFGPMKPVGLVIQRQVTDLGRFFSSEKKTKPAICTIL